jgi:FlaA1/EpsC-like NDP-sugar epimerase
MLRRYNRLLVAIYVVADLCAGAAAFALAYLVRFELPLFARIFPVVDGQPPFTEYVAVLPFVALLVPLAFRVQGIYRLRRSRTRVDDFFAVLVGGILAVLGGLLGTLYFRTYYLPDEMKAAGVYEVSQLVWALFLGFTVVLTYLSREVVRDLLRRRWRAGIGLKRVLIAGAGDLGRLVADRVLEHRELGFNLLGFVDDRAATGDAIGYRGLPLLGSMDQLEDICTQEKVDQIYVALPIEQHLRTLDVVEFASREYIDVQIVPDLLQFIALRARLEDLDGLPMIRINDVPLRGMNSVLKRSVDVALSLGVLIVGAVPALIIALLIRRGSPGPIFYTQERMGLDGKAFTVYKFRSMPLDAEDTSGPIWARDDNLAPTRGLK